MTDGIIRTLLIVLVVLLLCRAVGLEISRFTGIQINVEITVEPSPDSVAEKAGGVDI